MLSKPISPQKNPKQILYVSHMSVYAFAFFTPQNPKPNTKNKTHPYVRVVQNMCDVW